MILGYESYDHNFISIMNNNPEEVGTLGHLLVTVSLIEKDMEEEIVCNRW